MPFSMPRTLALASLALTVSLLQLPQTSLAASQAELIKTIKSVDKRGEGNVAAQRAFQELIKADASALPAILKSFEGANPLALNWLRNAVESIADRAVKAKQKLPVNELEKLVGNEKRNPRARQIAFTWIQTVEPKRAAKLVPGFLKDPSAELRRLAVQRLIDTAEELDAKEQPKRKVAVLKQALSGAVDDDQVKAIVKPLKKLGVEVDLQKHFGFLTQWQIIGPFDNKGGIGLKAVYPPEKEIDLKATYDGQLGKVKWQPISTKNPYGVVDIAKSLKNYKGSAMYMTTEYFAEEARSVEFRLGTPNSWKVWLNGKLLFAREEYHRGMALDQYKVEAKLKPGRNVILLKILQNEQEQDWAQRYRVQFRVCDGAGSAVLPAKTSDTAVSDR